MFNIVRYFWFFKNSAVWILLQSFINWYDIWFHLHCRSRYKFIQATTTNWLTICTRSYPATWHYRHCTWPVPAVRRQRATSSSVPMSWPTCWPVTCPPTFTFWWINLKKLFSMKFLIFICNNLLQPQAKTVRAVPAAWNPSNRN